MPPTSVGSPRVHPDPYEPSRLPPPSPPSPPPPYPPRAYFPRLHRPARPDRRIFSSHRSSVRHVCLARAALSRLTLTWGVRFLTPPRLCALWAAWVPPRFRHPLRLGFGFADIPHARAALSRLNLTWRVRFPPLPPGANRGQIGCGCPSTSGKTATRLNIPRPAHVVAQNGRPTLSPCYCRRLPCLFL